MTPEEVFAQLRDVHLPEANVIEASGLDVRPLIVFAVLLSVFVVVRVWSRLRSAKRRFNKVSNSSPPAEQRDQIVQAVRSGPTRKAASAVPPAFFTPPSAISAGDVDTLRKWARRRVQ